MMTTMVIMVTVVLMREKVWTGEDGEDHDGDDGGGVV